ncbi:Astacin (Peptidase family M12A) [Caballeronia terrestris]|uniref:Astacin (Peptidase family M12A) n=2 Tax=Caballeronia terrestris TaxID=1226301 RepID=A0A158I1J5_9BURK|nr:Astacin (Peptidase family M12A) [Caballeronia terrestris]
MATYRQAFLVSALIAGGSFQVEAHDLQGLMAVNSLPKKIQEQLKDNQKLRDADLPALTDPNLTDEQRKKLVKEKKLPKRFESFESVLNALALWPQKQHLNLCAFNGSGQVRNAVLEVAQGVISETNLSVSDSIPNCTRDDPAEIRITFRTKGYWSYVGTEALQIPTNLPTLGLSNIDLRLPLDEGSKGVIRHEFMHALGALHEHQHPSVNCEDELNWDYVAKTMHWSPKEMDVNFKQLVFNKNIKASEYDPKSIMHYQLRADYWKKGANSSCYLPFQNTILSDGDVKMMRQTYPKQ